MADYDAIIIGAGHNGLAAASVLAKNGLSVLVVEKTNWPGGMAGTKELFKGYKHSVGAWALLIFREEMMKLLELERYGLELITPRTNYCVFGTPEDAPFIGYSDKVKMTEHLMKDHGPDAVQSLAGLVQYMQVFKGVMDRNLLKPPEPVEAMIAGAPDAETREILASVFHSSAIEVIRRFFPDPERHRHITGSLTASAIDGTHMGPYTPGSAFSLAYHYTAGDEYDFKIPRGGIGAVSEALVKALERHAGEVQYKTQVKRLLVEDGKAVGVELRNGDLITSKVVLSSLDARTTFLGLVGDEYLPSPFGHAVNEIQYENGYVQIHLTLKEMPEYTGDLAFVNEDDIRWLMSYIPSPDHLARCWEQYRRGQVPEDPVSYCYMPSVIDPSLAPEGRYTCTFFSHYFPYNIPQEKHNEFKKVMADRMIDQMAKRAPNFRDAIVDEVILTQQYFEKTFGITGGDFCHGLLHPGQMWDRRPVPGWSNYRTPIENLFMCGASCHPGPGVTGVPGYNGAHEVLSTWQG
ncbi:MAG: NAD(P)/FAD-dependent oxidoreductase [Deltaproteobacteria bacterium]|nr:NAD(P)/FAD-dependent oxidoreductase [Deltaproteobacteria bacterium]